MDPSFYSPIRVEYLGITEEPCKPENILWTDEPWKGRVLFTGPNGRGDHKVKVGPEHRYVGIGAMSEESTSETGYLWRAAPGTPFPRPKTARIGEVGWSVKESQDWSYANSARQIMLGHFRQDNEDRCSHRYQNPWYPGPNDTIDPDSDAALVMNVYRSKTADPRIRLSRRFRRNSLAPPFMQYFTGSRFELLHTPCSVCRDLGLYSVAGLFY